MEYNLEQAKQILERTPELLKLQLSGLSSSWIIKNEGENTWSPYDVVGHFIHGEKTDWMQRAEIIINQGTSQPFKPFDRFAQFEESKRKSLDELLNEFENLRKSNLKKLEQLNITEETLKLKGIHPDFGEVTLKQLLSTWVVHDFNHLAQINRVMAKQYQKQVGPWIAYLSILKK
ncbi:DinB family protein [Psychroserpens sp. SPM9]|uniref:DinB family protein n=1 Tax=Psychroserpens sp. SPM9 TaxID=2975598 RepID=UPI0021A4AD00|nr:DinB family protein [Psychroserpens sp. SPM9]MDG5492903.1 DinB family protein [Psychroserpens sp. SPM9]